MTWHRHLQPKSSDLLLFNTLGENRGNRMNHGGQWLTAHEFKQKFILSLPGYRTHVVL